MTDDLAALRPLADGQRLDDVTVRALDLVIDANGDLDVWFAIGTGALEGRLAVGAALRPPGGRRAGRLPPGHRRPGGRARRRGRGAVPGLLPA